SPRISPVNKLNPARVLGTILGRRGEAGAWDLLDEALVLAEGTGEPTWIVPVREARAEIRWISGELDLAAEEARAGYAVAVGRVHPWMLGSAAIWLQRTSEQPERRPGFP